MWIFSRTPNSSIAPSNVWIWAATAKECDFSLRRHLLHTFFSFSSVQMTFLHLRYDLLNDQVEKRLYFLTSKYMKMATITLLRGCASFTRGNSTDRNILEDSYQLVKHFLDFSLWEYRFASFDTKLSIKICKLYSQSRKSEKCFTN